MVAAEALGGLDLGEAGGEASVAEALAEDGVAGVVDAWHASSVYAVSVYTKTVYLLRVPRERARRRCAIGLPEIVLIVVLLAGFCLVVYLAREQRRRTDRLRMTISATRPARLAGAEPERERGADEMSDESTVSADQKKRALSQAVVNAVAQGGRIESQTDEQAVVVYEEPDLLKYLFLTLITLGLYWLGGWLFYRPKKTRRTIIQIDDYGNALVTALS